MPTPYEFAMMARAAYEKKPVQLPTGWKKIDQFGDDTDNGYRGFYAAAYSNADNSEIVIAYRGTDLNSTPLTKHANLKSDIVLALGTIPDTLIFAQEFFHRIQSQYPNVKIFFTGHSLAAVHAELMGLRHKRITVTFDSPGSEKLVKDSALYDQDFNQYVTTYLAAPHFINTLNGHIGNVYRLMIPHVDGLSWTHGAACAWGTFSRATLVVNAVGSLAGRLTGSAITFFGRTAMVETVNRSSAALSAYAGGKIAKTLGVGVLAEKAIAGATGTVALLTSFYDTWEWALRQHSIDRIVNTFDPNSGQPYKELVKKVVSWPKLWPPETTKNWMVDELLAFVPGLTRNRGLHTLFKENAVLESQIEAFIGYTVTDVPGSSNEVIVPRAKL